MPEVAGGGTAEILEYFHRKLDDHFRRLHGAREQLEPTAPVFALEHDLSESELQLLQTTVRAAVAQGFGARSRQWWLPFVVYAAESGYDYVGDEYWPTFEAATPFWYPQRDRQRIKAWFIRFASDYGGAVPAGAFAEHFTIICWPITHAVLPTYLQRQLVQLLHGFRTGLTTDLLNDPAALGVALASRSYGYTERFRIFCENTALLGHVAAALLSGDDEESPYLTRPTLERLIEGLSIERETRDLWEQARQSASYVRKIGFRSQPVAPTSPQRSERLPSATDPKLFLRSEDGGWRAYAGLPDLTSLQGRLSHIYDELRTSRARIAGYDGKLLVSGRLLYPNQEVRLSSWPRREVPFIQLEHASVQVNALIADQCAISPGPWWLFRRRAGAPAVEVKDKSVRPGHSFCLVGERDATPPPLPWITETIIHVDGVRAFDLAVPTVLSDAEVAELRAFGISVLTRVAVRPVGVVASSWDGQGAVEWPVGEPAMIAVRAERAPEKCVISLNADPYVLAWPQQPDLLVALDGLPIGSHDVTVTLLGTGSGQSIAVGSLLVTISDPQVRPGSGTSGEGIRLLASPARPTLTELWDGRATLSIEGPPQSIGELSVVLRDAAGAVLGRIRHRVDLPMSTGSWTQFARRELQGHGLRGRYDEAESCEVAVSRAGVGFASLVCERGFQPLRWVIVKRHRGGHAVRLIDRTDGGKTMVEYFPVDSPLSGTHCAPGEAIEAPPRGGLLRATTDRVEASVVLPPDPNQLRAMWNARPSVQVGAKTATEVIRLITGHHNWLVADLPADPFARYQQQTVLNAITSTLISLIAGRYWAGFESQLGGGRLIDQLSKMQELVGIKYQQRILAKRIGDNLWRWSDSSAALESGFAEVIASYAAHCGLYDPAKAARFFLKLASNPGQLMDWDSSDRNRFIEQAIRSPVLVRAARFAVLGAEALRSENATSSAAGGKG